MALSLSYSYKRFVSGAVVYYSETVKYLAIYTIGIYLRPTAVSLASLHRCSWSVTLFEVSSTRLHNGQDRTVPCVSLCIYRSTTTPCSYRVLAHAVPSTIPSQCFWCVLSVLLVCSFSWQSSPSNHRHDSHTWTRYYTIPAPVYPFAVFPCPFCYFPFSLSRINSQPATAEIVNRKIPSPVFFSLSHWVLLL